VFDDLLGRLFGSKPQRQKRTPKQSEDKEMPRTSLSKTLALYVSKEEIQVILYAMNLQISGNKDELSIESIVKCTKTTLI
jgi:hypothetical protein